MQYIVNVILTVLLSLSMNSSVVDIVSTTPQEEAVDLMKALESQKTEVFELYADNEYVNFLNNVQTDERMSSVYDYMFENFSYEVIKTETKNDVAVVKITVKTNDFSKVDDAYEDAAYKYIMDNLGTDKVSDTEKLNAKCVELYVKQFEKAAKGEADKETTAFVTMISDRHHGWNVILTDELMKAVLGDVDLPVKQKADK